MSDDWCFLPLFSRNIDWVKNPYLGLIWGFQVGWLNGRPQAPFAAGAGVSLVNWEMAELWIVCTPFACNPWRLGHVLCGLKKGIELFGVLVMVA